jgi:hypothetical protein
VRQATALNTTARGRDEMLSLTTIPRLPPPGSVAREALLSCLTDMYSELGQQGLLDKRADGYPDTTGAVLPDDGRLPPAIQKLGT